MIFNGIFTLNPVKQTGGDFCEWIAESDDRICKYCGAQHGKIRENGFKWELKPPLHPNCRCKIIPLSSVAAGTATADGVNGADFYLLYNRVLPEYYITIQEALDLGWIPAKHNLSQVAPGKRIGGDIYYNDAGKLPDKEGRIWYIADINFTNGDRGLDRILYSNDGLIFVSYDGLKTFFLISEINEAFGVFREIRGNPGDGNPPPPVQISLDGEVNLSPEVAVFEKAENIPPEILALLEHPVLFGMDEKSKTEFINRYIEELKWIRDYMVQVYGEDYITQYPTEDENGIDNTPGRMYLFLIDPDLASFLTPEQRVKALEIYRTDGYFTKGVEAYLESLVPHLT